MSKKFLAICLVLAVCCSFVWAFPTSGDNFFGSSSKQEVTPPLKADSSATEEGNSSTSAPKETSNAASTLLTSLSDKSRLTKTELAAHKEALQDLADDYGMLLADKESIHPFVEAGVKVGFNNDAPVIGAVAGGGLKFSSGLTIRGNVGYDIARIKSGENAFKSESIKDRFSGQLTLGYEF